jgi:Uma2 family endonuclease
MATVPVLGNPTYPTSDGKPMAETDLHRMLMSDLIATLDTHFAGDPMTYVSGNLLVFYEPGNRRRHVSPDVFLVRGVEKKPRLNYLIWEEGGHAPDAVIELTSSSTRREDVDKKFRLYRDVLRVREYFLFDPKEDYLDPSLRGYRLSRGKYVPIKQVEGRLPSAVLDLDLYRSGEYLRLYDSRKNRTLPTPAERAEQAETAHLRAELRLAQAENELLRTQLENERLRRELDALRHAPAR